VFSASSSPVAMSSFLGFQPTFTQGLILGQISVLVLLVAILRYLFLDTDPSQPYSPNPLADSNQLPKRQKLATSSYDADIVGGLQGPESAEWFNLVLYQISQSYREEIRGHLPGSAGDEAAREKIERWANEQAASEYMDPICVHSVDLGSGSPSISDVHFERGKTPQDIHVKFKLSYTDTVSISLSTSALFNYPAPYFARLPISLTVSLVLFECTATLIPPSPAADSPNITLVLPPTFTLDLQTSSLLGSRAKLADVPKLHDMIVHRIRKALAERGSISLVLPGIHKERPATTAY